ncbi:MAG TPA: NAD-dependent epimerase/dehydratase family protein [Aliidongia sp.]|nr:NAD-dependent epimerase/dehydratase family protein [Aliidongia sp.]
MTILVTGAAGFIGFHLSQKLLDRDEAVIGIDNLNDYYDVRLKEARLKLLRERPGFVFEQIDIGDPAAMRELAGRHRQITRIVNLAAQAGVRYSIENPRVYARSNLDGFLEVLELARFLPHCEHLVYASSSSVYGAGSTPPFSTDERCDTPVSLYAATKRANELMAYTYSHLYRLKLTGLRFFTVYGPWGRPDMAPYLFTEAVLQGRKLRVFNNGDMRRDFTYVDDIVAGTIAALDHPPADDRQNPPHRLYNIGNHRSEKLMDFIGEIERACGRKAELVFEPMQPGDVRETFADIEPLRADFGYQPTISIAEGVPRFVAWYRSYYGV